MGLRLSLLLMLTVGCALCAPAFGEDWPQFRGPSGDGHSKAQNLPTSWGGFGSITWQAEIPGYGWSSPIVIKDRIWLATAEPTALASSAREKKLADSQYRDYRDQLQVHSSVTCMAVEIAATSGEVLRTVELFTCDDPPPIHATNGYASPTPVTNGKSLVCHFGSLGTACLDIASCKVTWKHRFVIDEITGPGSSPALAGNTVILPCDGADEQFVVGLDIDSGQMIWKTPRPAIEDTNGIHRRAFSTALVLEHAGRAKAIVPGAQWVVSYDAATGQELWRVNMGDCHAIIPRPVFRDGLVYVCTGYPRPQLWAIRAGGSGDVTTSHVAWKFDRQVPEISSPIVVDRELYFVSSLGIATCLDAESGDLIWQHRIGGNFASSPLAADGKLYFTSREGLTTVLQPGREYRELARNQLFGQTLASMAVCGHAFLIRADRTLYCIGKATAE